MTGGHGWILFSLFFFGFFFTVLFHGDTSSQLSRVAEARPRWVHFQFRP